MQTVDSIGRGHLSSKLGSKLSAFDPKLRRPIMSSMSANYDSSSSNASGTITPLVWLPSVFGRFALSDTLTLSPTPTPTPSLTPTLVLAPTSTPTAMVVPSPTPVIRGVITAYYVQDGTPPANRVIRLQKFSTQSPLTDTIVATATTDSSGVVKFDHAPAISLPLKYQLQYWSSDIASVQRTLDHRYLALFSPYQAGTLHDFGVVDLSDILPTSPNDGAVVLLPLTLRWVKRVTSSSDSYRITFSEDNSTIRYSTQALGYTDNYVLNSGVLPAVIANSTWVRWQVEITILEGDIGDAGRGRSFTIGNP